MEVGIEKPKVLLKECPYVIRESLDVARNLTDLSKPDQPVKVMCAGSIDKLGENDDKL